MTQENSPNPSLEKQWKHPRSHILRRDTKSNRTSSPNISDQRIQWLKRIGQIPDKRGSRRILKSHCQLNSSTGSAPQTVWLNRTELILSSEATPLYLPCLYLQLGARNTHKQNTERLADYTSQSGTGRGLCGRCWSQIQFVHLSLCLPGSTTMMRQRQLTWYLPGWSIELT